MVSNAFILGKYDRRNFGDKDISKSAEMWEGDKKENTPVTHIHNSLNVFSNHTERDEIQVVGKLYKGFIDDEDEIFCDEILDEREDFPRLSFRK